MLARKGRGSQPKVGDEEAGLVSQKSAVISGPLVWSLSFGLGCWVDSLFENNKELCMTIPDLGDQPNGQLAERRTPTLISITSR